MDTKNVIFLVALIAGSIALPPPKPDYSSYFTSANPGSRNVGGSPVAEGTRPYMAAFAMGIIITSHHCGASIVGSRHSITAAHCVPFNTNNLFIYVGSIYPLDGATVYNIQKVTIHPEYQQRLLINDIAIMETSSPIVFGPKVQPIAISFDHIGGGVPARLTGWGRTSYTGSPSPILLELETTTLEGEQCVQDALDAQTELELWYHPPVSPDVELCTYRGVGYGACDDDSGSPLVRMDTNEQIGVVSWGFLCAAGAPDVFTRISASKNWILEKISKNDTIRRT